MKKIILIILIVLFAWAFLRFVIGGPEDDWICDKEKGEWVKHGAPSAPKPTESCGDVVPAGVFILMKTNFGDIKLELFEKDAPKTVENFVNLSEAGFYDDVKFHRVIKDFMIQAGDPNSKDDDWSDDGMGGPGYTFDDEINEHKLVRGVLAMANGGADTNGSQFFIVTAESTPWLDGLHTAFGKVVEGMDVVLNIENVETELQSNHPIDDVIIEIVLVQR